MPTLWKIVWFGSLWKHSIGLWNWPLVHVFVFVMSIMKPKSDVFATLIIRIWLNNDFRVTSSHISFIFLLNWTSRINMDKGLLRYSCSLSHEQGSDCLMMGICMLQGVNIRHIFFNLNTKTWWNSVLMIMKKTSICAFAISIHYIKYTVSPHVNKVIAWLPTHVCIFGAFKHLYTNTWF